MKHKKKFYFFIFILALVVVHGVVSWWVGERAERLSLAQIQYFNEHLQELTADEYPDQNIQLELDTVHRGVWSSQRLLTVTWSRGPLVERYVFEDNLQHGPWPWARLRQKEWLPVMAYSEMHLLDQGAGKDLYEWSQGKEPLRIVTEIDWGGRFNGLWQWAAFMHDAPEGQFMLGAGELRIKGIGQGLYQLKAQAPAFSYKKGQEALYLTEPQIQWITTSQQTLFDGHLYVYADELEWHDDGEIWADDFVLELTQEYEEGFFDMAAQASAKEVVLNGGIKLGSFDIRLQLERIAEDIGARAFASLTEEERDELWLRSLAAYPRYTVHELNWRNDGGRARFSGFFELAPRLGDELEKVAFKADVPKAVLQEVIGQEKGMKGAMLRLLLDTFIKEGSKLNLIEFQDEALKVDLQYDQSADNYVLNGQAHDKKEMQGILFQWLLWLAQ